MKHKIIRKFKRNKRKGRTSPRNISWLMSNYKELFGKYFHGIYGGIENFGSFPRWGSYPCPIEVIFTISFAVELRDLLIFIWSLLSKILGFLWTISFFPECICASKTAIA